MEGEVTLRPGHIEWDGFVEWARSRPESVQKVMREFPPGCIVRTVDNVILLCPAPGVSGTVVSYFENGRVRVSAPASIPHPEHGWGTLEPGDLISAEVDPKQLRLTSDVDLTREMVALALDGEIA